MSWIHCNGAPWLQSETSSASGQRVLRNLDLRSSSTSSLTEMRKGVIEVVMGISFKACEALMMLPRYIQFNLTKIAMTMLSLRFHIQAPHVVARLDRAIQYSRGGSA